MRIKGIVVNPEAYQIMHRYGVLWTHGLRLRFSFRCDGRYKRSTSQASFGIDRS